MNHQPILEQNPKKSTDLFVSFGGQADRDMERNRHTIFTISFNILPRELIILLGLNYSSIHFKFS